MSVPGGRKRSRKTTFFRAGENSKKETLGDTIEEKLDSHVIKAKESGWGGRGWGAAYYLPHRKVFVSGEELQGVSF